MRPRRPKSATRVLQDTPRTLPGPPKTPQDCPRTLPGRPLDPPRAPRGPKRVPNLAFKLALDPPREPPGTRPETLRDSPDPREAPGRPPGGLWEASGRPPGAPGSLREASGRPPGGLQEGSGRAPGGLRDTTRPPRQSYLLELLRNQTRTLLQALQRAPNTPPFESILRPTPWPLPSIYSPLGTHGHPKQDPTSHGEKTKLRVTSHILTMTIFQP